MNKQTEITDSAGGIILVSAYRCRDEANPLCSEATFAKDCCRYREGWPNLRRVLLRLRPV